MKSYIFGQTALGMAIPVFEFQFGTGGPHLFVLGGVHGNETEGVVCAYGLMKSLAAFKAPALITLIPAFNLDGVLSSKRLNGNGVDLNRNLATKDWNPKAFDPKYPPGPSANSEPENKSLVKFIDEKKPKFIISLHSWKPLINVNGDCLAEAREMEKLTGYEIKEEIGYPTPGCLGTYTGLERNIPTITYEIERGLDPQSILKIHVPAVAAALAKAAERRA